LPESDEVGETVQKLGEGADDEGVQRGRHRGPKGGIGGMRARIGTHRGGDAGDLPG